MKKDSTSFKSKFCIISTICFLVVCSLLGVYYVKCKGEKCEKKELTKNSYEDHCLCLDKKLAWV